MQAKKEKIDEISAMSGGAIDIGSVSVDDIDEEKEEEEEEFKLRTVIQEAIKLYAQKNNMLRQNELFEEKIRHFIRSIILSEKQSREAPPGSTLEGIMKSLLNNIIPQIRIEYMQLQTNDEERQGFKDYFYNAVNQITDLTKDQRDADEEQSLEKDLEEEKVVIKSDDPDFISGVFDGDEDEKIEQPSSEGDKQEDVSSFFERGQNFGEEAFGAIKDRIQKVVASRIVPDEYPEFERVLNANLQAWFKIWDQNRTKEDVSNSELPVEPVEPVEPESDIENLEEVEIEFD